MHCLVAHQLFQQRCRAVPVDTLQFEEADVEPGSEQATEIGLQGRQQLVIASNLQQEATQVDQELASVRDGGELGQQPQPRRLQCAAKRGLGNRKLGGIARRLHLRVSCRDGIRIGIEACQRAQELLATGLIQTLVGLRQLCRPIANAHLAATARQTGAHLRGDRLIFDTRRHIPPDRGDPTDRTIEQSGDGDITHADAPRCGRQS